MKKIMFIMILASIFIPVSQTGATLDETNISSELKADKAQAIEKQALNGVDILNSEKQLQSDGMKREEKIRKITLQKSKWADKKISGKKRERLARLLLLAHGG